MRHNWLILTAALVGLPLVKSAEAQGQFAPTPGITLPGQQFPVSPYINLLRPGSSPFLNYYGLVRPQFTFQGAITGLNQQVAANQALITTGIGGNPGIPITGHEAVFLNTTGYFLTNTFGRGAGSQGLAPGVLRGGVGGAANLPGGGAGGAVPAGRGAPPAR